MAENSKIEWTDATWNPIVGCSVVSPGCTNCYAMRLAGTRMKSHPSRAGLTQDTKAGPVWNGEVRLLDHKLDEPLRWRKPRRIFVCAHGDLFHSEVPDDWIIVIYGVMVAAVHLRGHTFQVLTKRPLRARTLLRSPEFWGRVNSFASWLVMDEVDPLARRSDDARATLEDYGPDDPPPGIWLGVSVEDQRRADERIPHLLATPAAVRFLSAEPLLGLLDLILNPPGRYEIDALTGHDFDQGTWGPGLDWVIAGGESGPGARPMHPQWARSLRDQCQAANVAFFFKQWGEWGPPTDSLGALDWPYHKDYDRTHWFDARLCVRPADADWDDKYKDGAGAYPPAFDLHRTPEYLDQVARCPQAGCREAGRCIGNNARAAVTRVGKKRAGRLLDGRTWDEMPARAAEGKIAKGAR